MDASKEGDAGDDAGADAGVDVDADAGDETDAGADAGNDAGAGADGGLPDPTKFEHNIVFVTSEPMNGNLGGLAGADAKCQALATAAGLPGTYKAWLSTETVNAPDRLTGSRGWVRRDGLPFADTISDLTSDHLAYPAWLDEHGEGHTVSSGVWTGTTAAGTKSFNCDDWATSDKQKIGRFGIANSGGPRFTDINNVNCSANYYLMCFGTGKSKPVVLTKHTGRRAFVSSPWSATGGRAGADAQCQSEATAAGLTGTYLALLASSTDSPRSRFEDKDGKVTGAKWVRTDGLVVANTAEELFSKPLLAPIYVRADGITHPPPLDFRLWAGATELDKKGTLATTCEDWNPAPSSKALLGAFPDKVVLSPWGGVAMPCTTTGVNLLCLEK